MSDSLAKALLAAKQCIRNLQSFVDAHEGTARKFDDVQNEFYTLHTEYNSEKRKWEITLTLPGLEPFLFEDFGDSPVDYALVKYVRDEMIENLPLEPTAFPESKRGEFRKGMFDQIKYLKVAYKMDCQRND